VRASFICWLAVGLLAGHAAYASNPRRYRLLEGQGYTVCEAFLKNLNALPAADPPMVCELKIRPEHTEFTQPDWEALEVASHLPLIYEAEALLWIFTPAGTQPKPFAQWKSAYEARIAASRSGPPVLRRTVLDLNGHGAETLIWYAPPWPESCAESVTQLNSMTPFTSFGGHIFIQRKEDQRLQRIVGLVVTQLKTEVLLYRGKQPWFATASANSKWTKEGTKDTWAIGLHRVAPQRSQAGEYVVPALCDYEADR
jgi:hypothetical protein